MSAADRATVRRCSEADRLRIVTANAQLADELANGRYAAWNAADALMRASRRLVAAQLLHRAGVFPRRGTRCLEIGYGVVGWLGDLITWGVGAADLHGIELDPLRARVAQAALPAADLRVGDASDLPWSNDVFQLVIASTVFTSILDNDLRRQVAQEIQRVLAPGGALLWYDFSRNNPRNPNVRGVDRREIQRLFPQLSGEMRSVTLAPPLARAVAPRSMAIATMLEAVRLLRTHIVAVLVKPTPPADPPY